MVEILKEADIPYPGLASRLFPDSEVFPNLGGQTLIPFLGAGASLPSVSLEPAMNPPAFPSKEKVEKVLTYLGFLGQEHKRERTVVQFALALGYLMIHSQSRSSSTSVSIRGLINDSYPPSARQLADLFATLSNYDSVRHSAEALMANWPADWNEPGQEDVRAEWVKDLQHCFKLLIEVGRLQEGKDSLTSMAALYENATGRDIFWKELATIFQNKKATTETHKLVARAAEHHLTNVNNLASRLYDLSKWHYLVVTTNYDCLIEEALGKLPWVVLYLKKINPQNDVPHVSTRFSPSLTDEYRGLPHRHEKILAENFVIDVDVPIVIILKVHGSLFPDFNPSIVDDSIVITDFDYEDYIAGMGQSARLVVPSAASNLMHEKSFLFLGYSLIDWNIRTILTAIMRRRSEGQAAPDCAVMKDISRSAEAYCTRRNIRILQTTLDVFANEIIAKRGIKLQGVV